MELVCVHKDIIYQLLVQHLHVPNKQQQLQHVKLLLALNVMLITHNV